MLKQSDINSQFSKVIAISGILLLGIGALAAPASAVAQETHVVNCNCDTTDSTQAQEAADALAEGGDTVIMHNFNTGQSTVWNVTQQGTVTQGATQNMGAGIIDYSGPTGSGFIGISGSSMHYSSQWTGTVDTTCLSAFPCEAVLQGGNSY